jgi:eukaryotic-like serine/threonine-protein kinase
VSEQDSKAPESARLVGRAVGKYEVVRMIGGGGMGRVYEGLNKSIGKRVALKFIDKEAASPDAFARFQREAQAASAVESAHIVEIFDSGETDDGMPFIVMELLRGEDLGHHIRRLGRVELPAALQITAQILRGLHRAHEAGIIHRDLKPDNVFLLDRDDDQIFAKIVDFGVSKITRRGEARSTTITQEGTVLGTPVYMSPEQAQGQSDVDARTDLYSVGAILYEALFGRPPHSGGTYEQVIVNICMKDAEDIRTHNTDVPEGVARVIAKALSRDREMRYQSAHDFLDDLIGESGGVLSGRSVSTSDMREKSRNNLVIRSDSSSSGSKTLGAVSTVAAPPQQVPSSSTKRPPSSRMLYAAVGIGALLLGAGIVIFIVESSGTTATPPNNAPMIITVGAGSAKVSASAVSAAPSASAEPAPSDSAPAPSASASSSAPAESASATASAKPHKPPPYAPPPPANTGLHIIQH